MGNELATLSAKQMKAMVAATPTAKRAVLGKALKAACQYLKDGNNDYDKAFELSIATIENYWHLGNEILQLKKAGLLDVGGQPSRTGSKSYRYNPISLADLGVSKTLSKRTRKLAQKDLKVFHEWIGEKFDEPSYRLPTLGGAVSNLNRLEKKAKHKKDSAKAARAVKKSKATGVFHGDSFSLAKKIPDTSCALIFTDPPYDRKSIPMMTDLSRMADRILVDGGSLITFCGQYVMQEVIELLSMGDLRYFWIACCLHTGDTAQMREYGIKVKWKPMLWFVKGDFRRDREAWVEDLVVSAQEKHAHPWQQSVIEAKHFINSLTKKGELVVDPFCGGGTTAVAAKSLGRKWWTCDMEVKHVDTARRRINDTNV